MNIFGLQKHCEYEICEKYRSASADITGNSRGYRAGVYIATVADKAVRDIQGGYGAVSGFIFCRQLRLLFCKLICSE